MISLSLLGLIEPFSHACVPINSLQLSYQLAIHFTLLVFTLFECHDRNYQNSFPFISVISIFNFQWDFKKLT